MSQIKPLEFEETKESIVAKNNIGTFRSDYQQWSNRWRSVVSDLVRSYQIELWQNDLESAKKWLNEENKKLVETLLK